MDGLLVRKVVRCNGPEVSGDQDRIWYAIIESDAPHRFYVSVYHPEDIPPNPPEAACACLSEYDCLAFLIDEGYVKSYSAIEWLPADYALPPQAS